MNEASPRTKTLSTIFEENKAKQQSEFYENGKIAGIAKALPDDWKGCEIIDYSDEKIEPYLCEDDAELREIADDVEMFVHARYAVK